MQSEEFISTLTIGNSTQQSIPYDYTTELDWIFPVLVNIILMVVHFWFLISLIHYGIKNKMWRQTRNKSDVLNTRLVYGSVIGCAVACIIRLVITLVRYNIGFSTVENGLCDKFVAAATVSYTIVHLFVVLFLWSRQRSFFANRLLNFNYSRPIKYFSSYVIVFIFALIIFSLVYYNANNSYISSGQGCVLSEEHEVQIAVFLVPILSAMFYNISLLGLLFYALTSAKSFQKREAASRTQWQQQQSPNKSSSVYTINTTISSSSKCGSNTFHSENRKTPSTKNSRSRRKTTSNIVTAILQRTLIFAVVSILVDVLLQLINTFVLNPINHRRFVNMGIDVATFFNLIFVILSFATGKDMMTSPCKKY